MAHIYGHMKTTVELPDALLREAKIAAAQRQTSLKQLMIEGLEHVIGKRPAPEPVHLSPEESEIFELDEYGVPVFKKRDRVVTDELVNRMREELGI